MRYEMLLSMLVAVAALMLIHPADARAQGRFSFDAHGGIAVPAGELSEFTEVGPAFGVGIAYWLNPRVAVRADFNTSLLNGKDSDATGPAGPDADLLHVDVGLEYNLTGPEASPWTFAISGGAGASALEVDDVQGVLADFDETYFALNGGLRIAYELSRNVSIDFVGRWYLTFTDKEDTALFSQFSDVDPDGFSTASDIPLNLGIRIRTN
jgi:hypothetical protein